MPETQQPQPGPSPTPSPKPANAIEIGDIIDQVEGAIIVPKQAGYIASFFVSQDYLDTCSPEVDGWFVEFNSVASFMSASAFEERYGA